MKQDGLDQEGDTGVACQITDDEDQPASAESSRLVKVRI
jgi:hypothetical protein